MPNQVTQELGRRIEIAIKLVTDPQAVTGADQEFLLQDGETVLILLRQSANAIETRLPKESSEAIADQGEPLAQIKGGGVGAAGIA
jgi:hypothetical protein